MVGLLAFVSTPGVRLDVVLGMEPEGFVQAEMCLWPFGLVLMGKCEEKKLQGRGKGKGSHKEAQRQRQESRVRLYVVLPGWSRRWQRGGTR